MFVSCWHEVLGITFGACYLYVWVLGVFTALCSHTLCVDCSCRTLSCGNHAQSLRLRDQAFPRSADFLDVGCMARADVQDQPRPIARNVVSNRSISETSWEMQRGYYIYIYMYLYCIVFYSIVFHYSILYDVMLPYTVLYHILLSYIRHCCCYPLHEGCGSSLGFGACFPGVTQLESSYLGAQGIV